MKHFDSKAEVEEYVRELGIPATFFFAGTYMSNFPAALQKVLPTAFLACEFKLIWGQDRRWLRFSE